MPLRTFQIGSGRRPGEGLRIGAVRFLPRGVRKEEYAKYDYFDVWFPLLAPSADLLRWFRDVEGRTAAQRWTKFRERYVREMKTTDCRQAITLLAALSLETSINIGCYCADESHCHRSILGELIELAVSSGLSVKRPPV
jgi:uncharacterized protein YeaO (DUF488 family)